MGLEAKVGTLLDLADVGDRGALRLLTDAGDVLGKALAGVCTIADPSLVVIGGDLTARPESSEALLVAARQALGQALPPVANHDVQIVRAKLGPSRRGARSSTARSPRGPASGCPRSRNPAERGSDSAGSVISRQLSRS